MKKKMFVPTADSLESRIALTGGIRFVGGLPVLTTEAISKATSIIQNSFTHFATHGQNYSQLSFDLSKASNLIPWARRAHVPFTGKTLFVNLTQVAVADLQTNIQNNVANPVVKANDEAIGFLNSFVQDLAKTNQIVIQ
jgi:hypothetical protein